MSNLFLATLTHVLNGLPVILEPLLIVSVEIVEENCCQGTIVEAIGLFFRCHEIGQSICGVALVLMRHRLNGRVGVGIGDASVANFK